MQQDKQFDCSRNFQIDFKDYHIEEQEPLEQYHNACEIALFLNADINAFFAGRQYQIGNNNLMFIGEYEIHKLFYQKGAYYSRYVINVKKEYVDGIFRQLNIKNPLTKITNMNNRIIKLNLKQIQEMKNRFAELLSLGSRLGKLGCGKDELSAKLLLKLSELLLRIYELYKNTEDSGIHLKSQDQVRKIVEFIDEHYYEDIRLNLLGSKFFLNKFYITHLFKEVTGYTVVEYIQIRRIIAAQNLLKNTDKNTIDICMECGFNSLQHFYRIFKRITNLTPNEYRKNGSFNNSY